eukprot:7381787-Prymnesium_polylepis.2
MSNVVTGRPDGPGRPRTLAHSRELGSRVARDRIAYSPRPPPQPPPRPGCGWSMDALSCALST